MADNLKMPNGLAAVASLICVTDLEQSGKPELLICMLDLAL